MTRRGIIMISEELKDYLISAGWQSPPCDHLVINKSHVGRLVMVKDEATRDEWDGPYKLTDYIDGQHYHYQVAYGGVEPYQYATFYTGPTFPNWLPNEGALVGKGPWLIRYEFEDDTRMRVIHDMQEFVEWWTSEFHIVEYTELKG